MTLAVFSPCVTFSFLSFDDPVYVTENPLVTGGFSWAAIGTALSRGHYGMYHPLTLISYMAEHSLFGLEPWVFHLDNILLHAGTTAVLYLFLSAATGRSGLSAVTALLFGLHPLHVESVAWISERKDVLSTLPAVAGLWSYVVYARTRSRPAYVLSILLLALGLLAKPMIVSFPLMLFFFDFWPLRRWEWPDSWSRPAPLKRLAGQLTPLLTEKWPHLMLSIVSGVIGLNAKWRLDESFPNDHPFSIRLINALYSYWFYLEKTVWPRGLAAPYPYTDSLPPWSVAGATMFLIGATWCVIRLARSHPWAVTGWFFYVISLLPVSGLLYDMTGYQARADRWSYVPLIGIFILSVWTIDSWLGRSRLFNARRGSIAAVLVATCAVLTLAQLRHWRTSETLYTRALGVTRDNVVAHNNYAALFYDRGDLEGAAIHYQEALRIQPTHYEALYNMGQICMATARYEAAAGYFRRAIRTFPLADLAHQGLARAESALARREP